MAFPPSKDKNSAALSWVEWAVAIGMMGLGLSLFIYAFLALRI